ncbi:MAG: ATP-binding protein [Oscillospiraceae bacterium]|jgi:DNA replication protein DnaC|nr:ATP-binding protein [Oscillospiraceae bacterium]
MGYHKEIYETVHKNLEVLRRKEELKVKKKAKVFYKRFPRAKEIEKELSRTAVSVAKAVFSGSNAKEEILNLKKKSDALQKEFENLKRKINISSDFLRVRRNCYLCEDRGYLDGKMCACIKKMLKQEAYNRLNKLSPISLCSFNSLKLEYYPEISSNSNENSPRKRMEKIFSFCKKYALEFSVNSKNLFFQGATGLGKTHLSLAIAKEVLDKGLGVIYGSVETIVERLEEEKFSNSFDKDNYNSNKHIKNCDLLILDDLGVEFSNSFSNFAVYSIVDSRIMLGKPTIINTNLSFEELERRYSERLVSRIMGHYINADFWGNDIRQQKRDRNIKTTQNMIDQSQGGLISRLHSNKMQGISENN